MEKRCNPTEDGNDEEDEDSKSHKMCPSEFRMRTMIAMLNGIDYDLTTTGKYAQSDFIESLQNNRGFKCYAAKNVYFTQKMLIYTVQFIIMGVNDHLEDKWELQELVTKFDKLRKQNYKILAFGLNQVCHQSQPMLEYINDMDMTAEIDKLYTMKLELLEVIPKLLHTLIKNLPNAKAATPGDAKGYYEDMEKLLNEQLNTPQNEALWKTLFVDVVDTQQDLVDNMTPGKPIMMIKRQAALYYDRQSKLFEEIRKFVLDTMGLPEDEHQSLTRILLVCDALAAQQLSIPSWPNYFIKPLKPRICDRDGLVLHNKFEQATKQMWAFKTSGIMAEQMEVIRLFENLLKDMEPIKCKNVVYEKYATAAKEIQTKVCFPEAESCISALNKAGGEKKEGDDAASFIQLQLRSQNRHRSKAEPKADEKKEEEEEEDENFQGMTWFFNKIQSCFFRQLSALRKHGPISDILVTRENEANLFMLKMGYQAVKLTEHTPENTIWYCRYCGGGMAISQIEVKENHEPGQTTGDKTFNAVAPSEPGKSVVKVKITETKHIQFTKILIENDINPDGGEPEVLAALYSDTSKEIFEGQSDKIKPLEGLNLFFQMAPWKIAERSWKTYPEETQNELTTLEEIKAKSAIIIVEQYCLDLQEQFKAKAKIIQRFKNLEIWQTDVDTLDLFIDELKAGRGQPGRQPKIINLGAPTPLNPACQIEFKTMVAPFSYATLMTQKDKDLFAKTKPELWTFKLTPIKKMKDQEGKDIPIWLGLRQFYNFPEPKNDKQREPKEEELRAYEVKSKKLANGICTPQAPPFTYIEDSFLPPENFVGEMNIIEAMGCSNTEAVGEGSEDDCKDLIKDKFSLSDENYQLKDFSKEFDELLGREVKETLDSETGKNLMKVAEDGCKFSKTLTIKSKCTGKFLYLVRDEKKAIKELCVQDLTDPDILKTLTALPKEMVIPIQKTYYIMIDVSNLDFSIPEVIYKQFNVANWLRTMTTPLKGEKIKMALNFNVKFLISVDLVNFEYIGIKDEYTDEGYCNNFVFGDPTHAQYRNWNRFIPDNTDNLLDKDFTLRQYERSLMFAVQASPLADIKGKMGIADPDGVELWKENLAKNNKCKQARVFIPIDWSGAGNPFCERPASLDPEAPDPPVIKSVSVTQEKGAVEICDGSLIAIKDTYYLEVLIQQEIDAVYQVPSEHEVTAAKQHGFILQDPFDSYEYAFNGFNTKVRVWVKPDTTGFSTRQLVCRTTPFKTGIKFKVTFG